MKKASIIKIAGLNERKQSLYAIYDELGHTEYQVWSYFEIINKQFNLI